MKCVIFLLVYSLASAADLPDGQLDTGKKRYTLLNGDEIEVPRSLAINGRRYPCLPQDVLSKYSLLKQQNDFSGEATDLLIEKEERFFVLYKALQARYLFDRKILDFDTYIDFLKSFGLSEIYACAADANKMATLDVLDDCIHILTTKSAAEELLNQHCLHNEKIEDIVGTDSDITRLVAQGMSFYFGKELSQRVDLEISHETSISDSTKILLRSLADDALLVVGDPVGVTNYFRILRTPNLDKEKIPSCFFTKCVDALAVVTDPTTKISTIATCDTEEQEVKITYYDGKTRQMNPEITCYRDLLRPVKIEVIPGEYVITVGKGQLSVYDFHSEHRGARQADNTGLPAEVSVICGCKTRGQNLLYIGCFDGDFYQFCLDNIRNKQPLAQGCKKLPFGIRLDEPAVGIRPIIDTKKILFLRRSGELISYDNKKEIVDFTQNIGSDCVKIVPHPTDKMTVMTAHERMIKVWKTQKNNDPYELYWSYSPNSSPFSAKFQTAYWLGDDGLCICYKDSGSVKKLDVSWIMQFLDGSYKGLRTSLALCAACKILEKDRQYNPADQNVKALLACLPDNLKKILHVK